MRSAKTMKTVITFLAGILFLSTGFAQYGQRPTYDQRQYGQYGQTITINFNGHRNGNTAFQVVLDGTVYSPGANNTDSWNKNTGNRYGDDDITINNVQAGQHSIQVYRLRNNNSHGNGRGYDNNRNYGSTSSPVYSSTFTLRNGYDVTLDIRGNGEVQFSEKRSNSNNRRDRDNDDWRKRRDNSGYNNGTYRTPMADYQFSGIYQDVKSKWFQSNKVTAVRDAFNNTASYFSTYQITQLLQLISSEANRLELAKLSWRVVSDPGNFTQLYGLFSNQAYRDELDRYVRGNRF